MIGKQQGEGSQVCPGKEGWPTWRHDLRQKVGVALSAVDEDFGAQQSSELGLPRRFRIGGDLVQAEELHFQIRIDQVGGKILLKLKKIILFLAREKAITN